MPHHGETSCVLKLLGELGPMGMHATTAFSYPGWIRLRACKHFIGPVLFIVWSNCDIWFQFEFSGLLLDLYVHADILYLEHQAICDLHDYSHQCFSWVSTFSASESRHCAKLLSLGQDVNPGACVQACCKRVKVPLSR